MNGLDTIFELAENEEHAGKSASASDRSSVGVLV
jgi:hypothetical protein